MWWRGDGAVLTGTPRVHTIPWHATCFTLHGTVFDKAQLLQGELLGMKGARLDRGVGQKLGGKLRLGTIPPKFFPTFPPKQAVFTLGHRVQAKASVFAHTQ